MPKGIGAYPGYCRKGATMGFSGSFALALLSVFGSGGSRVCSAIAMNNKPLIKKIEEIEKEMQLNEDLKFFIPRLRDKIQMEGKIISANLLLVYKKKWLC